MLFSAKRWFSAFLTWALLARAAVGCGPSRTQRLAQIDAALLKAGQFLIEKQSADGAWRSETYGCFRAGPTLTPHVMSSLFFIPQAGPSARAAFRKGVDCLVGFVGQDGRLKVGQRELLFPVFAAASASRVVVLEQKTPRNLRAQRAWLAYLRQRQLNERLGWKPSDLEYGGWGFSLELPRKPAPGRLKERFFESNMVATVFGLAALRSARLPADDPSYKQILTFAYRCQNFPEAPSRVDARFDDGGFFFIPGDPLQNKAGLAGTDRLGRRRFHSYGTITADGVRILLRCGLQASHPRVAAARRWLERNFSAKTNPGDFNPDREILRDGVYYYWVWAVSHAFLALRVSEIRTPRGKVNWAEALADELIGRQRGDGAWVNRFTDAKEDDPLVCTPYAAATLAICRTIITGQYKTLASRCPTVAAPGASPRSPPTP